MQYFCPECKPRLVEVYPSRSSKWYARCPECDSYLYYGRPVEDLRVGPEEQAAVLLVRLFEIALGALCLIIGAWQTLSFTLPLAALFYFIYGVVKLIGFNTIGKMKRYRAVRLYEERWMHLVMLFCGLIIASGYYLYRDSRLFFDLAPCYLLLGLDCLIRIYVLRRFEHERRSSEAENSQSGAGQDGASEAAPYEIILRDDEFHEIKRNGGLESGHGTILHDRFIFESAKSYYEILMKDIADFRLVKRYGYNTFELTMTDGSYRRYKTNRTVFADEEWENAFMQALNGPELACPKCGMWLEGNEKFCGMCRSKLV